jgi:nucleotide-binding universal stress UspA family protein
MSAIKVLLPLDGSRTAEHSLVYLDAIKRLGDCTVDLLCVADESEDFQHQHSNEALEREANLLSTYLRELANDVASHVGVEVIQRLVRGNPALCILEEVAAFAPDLLVISTHGRTGAQRWRLGSVADKVIRGATCTTLVIGPKAHDEEVWLDVNAVEPFKSILVPLDGSQLAERAIAVASRYAECFDSTIHLVQVVRIPLQTAGLAGEDALFPELLDSLEAAATDYVHQQSKKLAPAVNRSTHVLFGDAATQLEEYVEARGIDLLVMTSHGRGGFTRTALGSVCDRMLAEGGAPVLIVRAEA